MQDTVTNAYTGTEPCVIVLSKVFPLFRCHCRCCFHDLQSTARMSPKNLVFSCIRYLKINVNQTQTMQLINETVSSITQDGEVQKLSMQSNHFLSTIS